MRQTLVAFDLLAWSTRMGRLRGRARLTQREAADLLGLSERAYAAAERRCLERQGSPCAKTLALLAQELERAATTTKILQPDQSHDA